MPFERYIPSIRMQLTSALLLLGVSCVKEDELIANVGDFGDDTVSIVATVAPDKQTRAENEGLYIDEGTVDRGTFYLFFSPSGRSSTSTSAYKSRAIVEFGLSEDPTTGYAYNLKADKTRKDLKWSSIYNSGGTSTYFQLTNIPPELYNVRTTSTSSSSVGTVYQYSNYFRFISKTNPYVAGPLDEVNGTNDILFGQVSKIIDKTTTTAGRKIQFDNLYHALSLLQVVIEVYPSEKGQELTLSLDNAKIEISCVDKVVGSFNCNNSYYSRFLHISRSSGDILDLSTSNTYYQEEGRTMGAEDGTPLVLVNPEIDRNEALNADAEERYKYRVWESIKQEDNFMVYTTKRFVMPPQPLPPTTSNGVTTPELLVTVPKSDMGYTGEGTITYRGYIPGDMYDNNGTPFTTALNSGTQLTIKAKINSPDPELTFSPVKVEPWVGKGTFEFNMRQAGIYNAQDFKALLDLYDDLQNGDEQAKNLAEHNLEKYGYRGENGELIFQLWGNLTLYEDKIKKKMPVIDGTTPDFSFMFNGFTVTTVKKTETGGGGEGGGEGTEQPEDTEIAPSEDDVKAGKVETVGDYDAMRLFDFYNLLTGKTSTETLGINNEQDFWAVVDILCSDTPKITDIMKYGVLSNIDELITFDINATFDIDKDEFEKIYRKIPEQLWEYKIQFTIHEGEKVTIQIPAKSRKKDNDEGGDTGGDVGGGEIEEETPYEIECVPGYCPLNRLSSKRNYGVATAEDFYFMADWYTNCYYINPDLFELFGSSSTIYFRSAMTLEGSRTYLSMLPNTSVKTDDPDYRPDYSVSCSSTITIEDELVPSSTSSGTYLKPMLFGSGAARGDTSLSYIVDYYNNNSYNQINYYYLWYYGRFDFDKEHDGANPKWIFPLQYSKNNSYVTYDKLFNTMHALPEGGMYDYEFELYEDKGYFYVTNMPVPDEEGKETDEKKPHYFYQTDDETHTNDYYYPNTAAELKRVADGTYWEWLQQWLIDNPKPEPEPDPQP